MTNPTVLLAGKPYEVPPLVWKQLRIVISAFSRLRKLGRENAVTIEALDEQALIVYTAVLPSLNGMSMEDFSNLTISQTEMLDALLVVAEQSGMKKADGAPGEAKAEIPPT